MCIALDPVCIQLLYEEACAFSIPSPIPLSSDPDSCYGILRAGPLRTTSHVYFTVSVPYISQHSCFHFGTR